MSKTLYVDKIKPQSLTVGELATVTLDLDEMINVPSSSPAGFYLRLGDASTVGGLKLLIHKSQIVGLSLIASEINIDPDITPYGSTKTVHQALSTLATNLSVSGTLVSMDDTSAGSTTKLWSSSKIASELSALGSEIATSILPPVADVSTLKAIDTTSLADKVLIFVESKGLYRFDADSTATGDDDGVVDPTTGDGRWIKMSSTSSHNAITIATGSTSYLSVNATQELSFAKNDLIFSTDAFSSTGKLVKTNSTGREIIITGLSVDSSNNLTAASFVKSGGTSAQFLKADGSVDSTSYQSALTNPITGTGTANEIAYFPTTSTVGSLATATYPSLTELSYVKGVTSAIQTQLGTHTTQINAAGLATNAIPYWDGSKLNADGYLKYINNVLNWGFSGSYGYLSWNTGYARVAAQQELRLYSSTNIVKVNSLEGTGTRLVTADANGQLGSSTALSFVGNDYIKNQNSAAQTFANLWIDGIGKFKELVATEYIQFSSGMYSGDRNKIMGSGSANDYLLYNTQGNVELWAKGGIGMKIAETTGVATFASTVDATSYKVSGSTILTAPLTSGTSGTEGYTLIGAGITNAPIWVNTLFVDRVNGNVGINTVLPSSAQGWGKVLQIKNTGTNGSSLSLVDVNGEYSIASYAGGLWFSYGSDAVSMFISSAGKVAIGYSDPEIYRLKVNGTGFFNGMVTATTMKLTTIGTGTMDKIIGITSDGTFTTDTVVINCRGGARAA